MIEGIPITDFTAPSLLGIAIIMILTGLLVPKSTYREKATECDRWREAYETSETARRELDSQTAELLETAKTSHAMILAVFQNSEAVRKAGVEANVVP